MAGQYDFLSGVQSGQDWVKGLYNDRAMSQAGGQLALGNASGAAQTLYRSGNIAGGQAVTNQAATERTAAATARTAATAQQLETTLRAARALKTVRDSGGDLGSAFDALTPSLTATGAQPGELATIRHQIAANPAFLDQIEAMTAKQMEYELRAGVDGDTVAIGLNPTTGATTSNVAYSAPREPKRVAVGNDYIEVGADGTVTPLYQGEKAPEYRSVRNSDGTETIVELGGRPGGVIGGGSPAPNSGGAVDVVSIINDVLPGVTPNSGLRTPSQNSGAGGANRSYHLRGQAIDVPRQQGKTLNQVRDEFRARGLDVREALDEGDHWHFAWGNDAQVPNYGRGERPAATNGDPRVVAQGQNNGLSPAEIRAQASADRQDVRANRQDVRQLHSEFEALDAVKVFRNTESAYKDVVALAQRPSGVNDTALTYAVMKMAAGDGSVVRESEFQLLGRAAGIPDQTIAAMTRAANGESLTPRMRQMVVQAAGTLRQARLNEYNQAANRYRSYAQEDGVSPDRIAPLVSDQSSQRRRPQTNTGVVPFDLTPAQLRSWQALGRSGGDPSRPLGDRLNPRPLNPAPNATARSWQNIPSGSYFYHPDGSIRRKP